MPKRKTTEQFIEEARKVHGNIDDFSKVEYKNTYTPITLICPIHGEYQIRPHEYLRGARCIKCGYDKSRLNDFKTKAITIHGNDCDYSKSEYKNYHTKVLIKCNKCGNEFWQSPAKHLSGQGCPKCRKHIYVESKEPITLTTEEFIKRVQEIHGDKYICDKVQYKNYYTKVCLICKEHGEFWATPKNILEGKGCPHCVNRYITTEQYVTQAKIIHGDDFDYTNTNYINNKTKILIKCNKCGKEFWQLPSIHLKTSVCPCCELRNAQSELKLFNILKDHYPQLNFIYHYRNTEILGRQEIDIYSPIYNIGIEYQGEQHFIPIDYFGGEKRLQKQIKNDLLKIEKCKSHNIELLHFSFNIKSTTENYILYNSIDDLFNKIDILIAQNRL